MTPVLGAGGRGGAGLTGRRDPLGRPPGAREAWSSLSGVASRVSRAVVDHADHPRRLVSQDDASAVRACAYPDATGRDGMRWWGQRDRRAGPLHGVDGPSHPGGVCITPASGREAWPRDEPQGINDLVGRCPSSVTCRPFEGTDRSFPLSAAFPSSEYYDASDARILHRWTAHLHMRASHVHTNTLYEMV